MKHPGIDILQDYFENALEPKLETRVKAHIEGCDYCTSILSEFVMLETRLKAIPAPSVSQMIEAKIFREASELLNQRREYKAFLKDWKENIFPEIQIPALQLASVSLMIVTFISIEKIQSTEEIIIEPLSSEVQVYEGEGKA